MHATCPSSLCGTKTPAATLLLDSPAEPVFDRYTKLAASALKVPVALFTIMDHHRQFFKSAYGLPEPVATRRETPLAYSFCHQVVSKNVPLALADARKHLLLRSNLAVAEYGVVAYAGVPIVDDTGEAFGAFCVLDFKVRQWEKSDLELLQTLAGIVGQEVAMRQDFERRGVEFAKVPVPGPVHPRAKREELCHLSKALLENMDAMNHAPLNGEQQSSLQTAQRQAQILHSVLAYQAGTQSFWD